MKAICLDTSVWIKYLCPDEEDVRATDLVEQILTRKILMVAPSFSWAEVGSVLLKKVRLNLLTPQEAQELYQQYIAFSIRYLDSLLIKRRAWELAKQYDMPTLYDAVFLACAEQEEALYCTADQTLLRKVTPRPAYIYAFNEINLEEMD